MIYAFARCCFFLFFFTVSFCCVHVVVVFVVITFIGKQQIVRIDRLNFEWWRKWSIWGTVPMLIIYFNKFFSIGFLYSIRPHLLHVNFERSSRGHGAASSSGPIASCCVCVCVLLQSAYEYCPWMTNDMSIAHATSNNHTKKRTNLNFIALARTIVPHLYFEEPFSTVSFSNHKLIN